ncbi:MULTISPECIES: DL-endopeptidase inhibitor IseA family protein [unclassified Paenibacillus]
MNLNGIDFQIVNDERFDTPEKVKLYFKRYWSDNFAKTMMCNLGVISINGETATILGDPPALPSFVEFLSILKSSSDTIKVRAVLSGEVERDRVIHYVLRKSDPKGNFRIFSRSCRKGDSRYEYCKCCLD